MLLLLQAASARGDWREWEAAKVRLHAARIGSIERSYNAFWGGREEALDYERSELKASLKLLTATNAPTPKRGVRLEAYISANDDSAQPFWRYLPHSLSPTSPPPLIIVLHGYDPNITLATAQDIPGFFTNIAEHVGACVAAPFGRGNTDFQTIGEQDVLRVLDEMAERFGINRERVVLYGFSMGGLGAWCLGARWADRFNMLMILSGRADFYVWHKLAPAQLPPWQRELVDTQFATHYLDRLTKTLVVAAHGRHDSIVSFEQGIYPAQTLTRLGSRLCHWIDLPDSDHNIYTETLAQRKVQLLLLAALTRTFPKPPTRSGISAGSSGSRLQDAFLRPFIFVGGSDDNGYGSSERYLAQRAAEWQRFAHARPRMAMEGELEPTKAATHNLFIFGEPEESALVRTVLEAGAVQCVSNHFLIAGRTIPREGHGLWFTGQNPYNTNLTAVVQCGIAWGKKASDNHRYDRLPDVIAYNEEGDLFGYNVAIAAGFRDPLLGVRWCDPPFTEEIRAPPPVTLNYDWDYYYDNEDN